MVLNSSALRGIGAKISILIPAWFNAPKLLGKMHHPIFFVYIKEYCIPGVDLDPEKRGEKADLREIGERVQHKKC